MNDLGSTTQQKALALNRDPTPYGAFAEIGGGQEVARWFFSVGNAAGTVAKTISAYDMAVSDAVYGPARQYVSRKRLEDMLDHEFSLLVERLGPTRGSVTAFFAFADTVTTRSYYHPGRGRGWVGIRFQSRPQEAWSEIIVHVNFCETSFVRQQEALGILGVNLIYAAYYLRGELAGLVGSLMDNLSRDRIEIDMIKLSGADFATVDNRLMSLQLVEQQLTDAAMFTADGEVVQPSEVLYKKPILVERGSFRPVTKLTLDLIERARDQFVEEAGAIVQEPVVLAEMTLRSLSPGPDLAHSDFLARADILGALGIDVLISRFEPYFRLSEYLNAYSDQRIGIALGLPAVREMANEKYYASLPGGALEAAGRLFKRSVKLYIYPEIDPVSGQIHTIESVTLTPSWRHLRALLLETGQLEAIRCYNESYLRIFPAEVLGMIERDQEGWEETVPAPVARMIKAKHLFGYRSGKRSTGEAWHGREPPHDAPAGEI